ncbi:putative transferase CAF17, mitochondrial isoform X2 [Gopherus evgoodei]|uniref:Iron-sulfur cluster assembly factor IBA57, mitochondrial n=1 Tax=Gopherus evgoodei TaxID=1825980 RepID=A0A8C4WLP5_9SAUR|nr:putative transferase CAF17, mitochondrial isoform X2 [Gopherus evgoodei]
MLLRAGAAVLGPPRRPPRGLGGGGGMRRLSGGAPPPPAAVRCFPLSRALLRVQGPEADTFLQGLLTNDVARLMWGGADHPQEGGAPSPLTSPPPRAQYTHALNVQGRCLYDLILYRLHESQEEEPNILLECDYSVLDSVQKHLKLYKIRRKVNIAPCLDLSLWAVIPEEQSGDVSSTLDKCADKTLVLTPDPRVEVMGWRLITNKEENPLEIVPGSHIGNISDYHRHRYKQGIAEGVKDIPPGVALPLESNLAYMNGISFTKGCYIGQELTARTHHTGVIRKRLLPVQLSAPLPLGSIPEGAAILTESGKSAGKYRAGGDELGIALLRLANINEPLHINLPGDTSVNLTAAIPNWWPKTTNK